MGIRLNGYFSEDSMTEEATKRAKSSRRRGKRGEYLLRDYLRARGFQSDRVPSSGAAQGFKGDVTFDNGTLKGTAELKNHSGTFKKLYDLYFENVRINSTDIMSFSIADMCIDMSTSIDSVYATESVYPVYTSHKLAEKYSRTFQRFGTLKAMKGTSDIFVIKDNRMPFLFIRFR